MCSECCPECCTQLGYALPVIIIFILILWSYYVYTYEMCWLMIREEEPMKMWLYFAFFHIFFLPFLVMYTLTSCHREWHVPDEYRFTEEFYEDLDAADSDEKKDKLLLAFCRSRSIRVFTRTSGGNLRVCHECKLLKPDRTHHCSVCRTCVIKMDHHCPWVNNCIGHTNYKFFMMLVLYGSICYTYYFSTSTEYVIAYFMNMRQASFRQLNVVIAAIIAMCMAVALWCLLGFHINLILCNETTLEAVHPPTFHAAILVGFDKGKIENWVEVCSSNCFLWWLPVDTHKGDGVNFEVLRY